VDLLTIIVVPAVALLRWSFLVWSRIELEKVA
jgi:hypothetical protein